MFYQKKDFILHRMASRPTAIAVELPERYRGSIGPYADVIRYFDRVLLPAIFLRIQTICSSASKRSV